MLSRGDFSVFLHRPLALAMLVTAAILLALTLLPKLSLRREQVFKDAG
jgi:TctA family transporter